MKLKKIISAALSMLFLLNTPVCAAESGDESKTVKFIVELKERPVIEDAKGADLKLFAESETATTKATRLRNQQNSLQSKIEDNIDQNAKVGFNYTYALNGFSMEGTAEDMARISQLPEVKGVYPVCTFEAPPETGVSNITNCCSEMNIAYLRDNGVSGQGQVIAVIDSGFDTQHDMFSGEIEGAALSKDNIESIIAEKELSCESDRNITVNRVYKSQKIPFAYNYANKTSDVFNGTDHGTHVAGIAAGNNGVDVDGKALTGAAPDAQLLLMAVQKENAKFMEDDAVLAALDDAAKIGADVVNCSFGKNFDLYDKLEEDVKERLKNAGISVIQSAGNLGRGVCEPPKTYREEYYGTYAQNIDYGAMGSSAASAVTSVASSEPHTYRKLYYTMYLGENEIEFVDQNSKALIKDLPVKTGYEYVYCGNGVDGLMEKAELNGKLALMEVTDQVEKIVSLAKQKGAVGIIMINDSDKADVGLDEKLLADMPIAGVSTSVGDSLVNAENKTLRIDSNLKYAITESENKGMSFFSSWCGMRNMELKPEITAPGGNIYSSVPNNMYQNMGGTSMAAPHLAGATALLRQMILRDKDILGINDNTNIAVLAEKMLMSAANIVYREDGIPASPRQQGAGLINLENSVRSPVILSTNSQLDSGKPKISFGEMYEDFTIQFNALNFTENSVQYDNCSLVIITDAADSEGKITDMRKLSFSSNMPETITIDGKTQQTISVNVNLDRKELEANTQVFTNGFYIDGFVILSTKNGAYPELSLPFTGFYGSWGKQSPFDNNYYNSPVLKGNKLLTTYLNSDDESVKIPLGENSFWSEDGYGKTYSQYNAESFAAISPNNDKSNDELQISTMFMKNAGRLNIEIYNSKNQKVFSSYLEGSDDDSNCLAKMTEYTVDVLDPTQFADDDYSIILTTTNFGKAKKFSAEPLKFYVDTKKPEFTKYEIIEENGSKMLHIAAKDNRNIMGFSATAKNMNGGNELFEYAVNGKKEAEAFFDLTNINIDTLEANVYDYAGNSTFYEESSPETEILYGDVNGDEMVTDADWELLLQKVTDSKVELPIQKTKEDWFKYADVDADKAITAKDAAMIFYKLSVNSFVFPAENLAK